MNVTLQHQFTQGDEGKIKIKNSKTRKELERPGDSEEIDASGLKTLDVTIKRTGNQPWPETVLIFFEENNLKWPVESDDIVLGLPHHCLLGSELGERKTFKLSLKLYGVNPGSGDKTTVTIGDAPPTEW